jgi:hypothetical protein
MLHLRVNNEIRKERWETCKGCKFFVAATSSCGPLITGRTLTPEETKQLEVRHYKKKVRLCGCVMKVKTFLPFASCPAGKWGAVEMNGITPEHVAKKRDEIVAFLKSIDGRPTLTTNEIKTLLGFIAYLYNRRVAMTTCSSCIINYIDDLKKQVKEL